MVLAQKPPRSTAGEPLAPGTTIETRRAKPLKWWALIGAAALGMQIYVMGRWVLSDDFEVIDSGSTEQTDWDAAWNWIWQVGGCIALAGFLYWFVVKPWTATRQIPLDGLLVLCFSLIVWQDPLCNYVKPWGTYNTNLVQWGSWVEQVPGWMSPRGHYFAEPLLVMVPVYVWGVFGFTLIGCAYMRWVKRRWPAMGTFGMIAACYGFFIIVDLVLESLWMRTGIWAYPGEGTLTLFEDGRYAFPIKEAFLWGAAWTGFTCVRYFRNDKNETFAERGSDQVNVSPNTKMGLRFLALYGAINVVYLFAYNVPMNVLNMHNTEWNPHVQEISYMNDNLCGEGTDYACPTKDTPIPWNGSAHLRPDGTVAPSTE